MLSQVQAACIKYITHEWQKLKPFESKISQGPHDLPPWGVWIEHQGPMPEGTDIVHRRPQQVWFLDKDGLKEHDPDIRSVITKYRHD